MTIKRVWIEPGCIMCDQSVENCPEVFEIPLGAESARVKEGIDCSKHEEAIKRAAAACPVNVIKYEEK
jgi:ferredoxin